MYVSRRTALCATLLLVPLMNGCGDAPTDESTADEHVVYLPADGEVSISWSEDTFLLSDSEPMAAAKALSELELALRKAFDKPELRAADGTCTEVLKIETAPDAEWLHAQWIMQAAAHPAIRVWQVELRTDADAAWTPIALSKDVGAMGTFGREYTKVKLTLVVHDNGKPTAQTQLRVDYGESFLLPRTEHPGDEGYEKVIDVVAEVFKTKHRGIKPEVVEIVAPAPNGGAVPVEDVLRVYQMVRAMGHETIHLEGASPPIMRPPSGG